MAASPLHPAPSPKSAPSTIALENHSPTWAEVDLDALTRNYDRLKTLIGAGKQIIVPVKANGYGHGATRIAACLARRGAYAVQTASVREAVAIRRSGNGVKIIAYPVNLAEDVHALLQNDIVPTVVDMAGARIVSAAATRPVAICVKVDAGLQRLGVPLDEAEDIIMKMAGLPNVMVEGVYTHVPFADLSQADWAIGRVRAFEVLVKRLLQRGLELRVTQAHASAHVIANIEDSLTAVCAGHFLYGLRSFPADSAVNLPSEPVLRAIKTRLIQVRPIGGSPAKTHGDPYGANFEGVTRTGVLSVGRANGILRPLHDKGAYVLVAGRPSRVISVTLEYTVVDLSGHPDALSGDTATILGDDGEAVLTIDDATRAAGCSPLDFSIGLRDIALIYRGGE